MTTDTRYSIFDNDIWHDIDKIASKDQINRKAQQIQIRAAILTAVAATLVAVGWGTAKALRTTLAALTATVVAVGWTTAKTVTGARNCAAWSIAAFKVGYDQGMNRHNTEF